MSKFQEILLFAVINAIGFLSPSLCYYIGALSGVISTANPDFDPQAFRMWYFPAILMTWMACAVFSIAFFFIRDNGRYIFLLAPAVVPVLYGLSAL